MSIFSLEEKDSVYTAKNSLTVPDVFPHSPRKTINPALGEHFPWLPGSSVSTHVMIWQDAGISMGRHVCLLCTLPSSLRSVLAVSLPSVSLVAGEEFPQIMTPSRRHFSN